MSSLAANIIAGAARVLAAPAVRYLDEPGIWKQSVYFANHASHLDFLILWSALPAKVRERTRPIAGLDYWRSGMRKHVSVDIFRSVLVQRSQSEEMAGRQRAAQQTIALLAQVLRRGDSLIVFPEGGRQEGEVLMPFKSGIFYLWAECPQVQFVPVYLRGLGNILPKEEVLPVPTMSAVTFGEPLRLHEDETKQSFLRKAHAAVCGLAAA
jgi:1-acyl-sn-glycerol-3-phosphate acyltransferase